MDCGLDAKGDVGSLAAITRRNYVVRVSIPSRTDIPSRYHRRMEQLRMLDELRSWASEDDNIRLVVLTGSFARGDAAADALSDLDIELYSRRVLARPGAMKRPSIEGSVTCP